MNVIQAVIYLLFIICQVLCFGIDYTMKTILSLENTISEEGLELKKAQVGWGLRKKEVEHTVAVLGSHFP